MRLLPFALGAVFHVAPGGSDAGACSAASPCKSIKVALGKASSGDTVEVATGTYTGAQNRDITMPAGVTLRGAGPYATILDIQAAGRGFHFDATTNGAVVEKLA